MYKQKKINKDDVTMNKPETRERKQSAATCAPNKEKTLDLIKIHENEIKKAVNKDKDYETYYRGEEKQFYYNRTNH